jgi:hypothetical protein
VTDLATVTADDFDALEDRPFARVVAAGEPALAITLAEIRRLRPRPGERPPFALVFVGPANPTLEPGVHPLRHAVLGDLELFLTPVGGDADTRSYEAVFG